jgi:hypothetical protein
VVIDIFRYLRPRYVYALPWSHFPTRLSCYTLGTCHAPLTCCIYEIHYSMRYGTDVIFIPYWPYPILSIPLLSTSLRAVAAERLADHSSSKFNSFWPGHDRRLRSNVVGCSASSQSRATGAIAMWPSRSISAYLRHSV